MTWEQSGITSPRILNKAIVKRLFEKHYILKQFPRSGRIVPEKNEEAVRELIEGNYRIIYEILEHDVIYILTVRHSARQLEIDR